MKKKLHSKWLRVSRTKPMQDTRVKKNYIQNDGQAHIVQCPNGDETVHIFIIVIIPNTQKEKNRLKVLKIVSYGLGARKNGQNGQN